MAAAPVPAAQMALRNVNLNTRDISGIKTHNSFVVNDLYIAQQLEIDPFGSSSQLFNDFGSSLIFGHPKGPTAPLLIIEGLPAQTQQKKASRLFLKKGSQGTPSNSF